MTDKASPDNQKTRRILAPHLWMVEALEPASGGPLFYLSWSGWELYLTRRLLLTPNRELAAPLLLPDARSPEHDFAAIDQLVKTAGELGAGFLSLRAEGSDNFAALTSSILHGAGGTPVGGPILDDRSYLALWTVSEYHVRQSDRLLAEAAERERAMWAALKGEGDGSGSVSERPDYPGDDTGRRAAYAWRCWRRLAGPLLIEADIIIPTAAEDGR